MWKFVVFGKTGCSLCKNRETVILNTLNRENVEGDVEVIDVDSPDGMVELSMLDGSKGEIPVVCAYQGDTLKHMWDGPYAKVTTKTLREILSNT